jgi:phage shock protein A
MGQDDLARAALERAMTCKQMRDNFAEQVSDQRIQVEELKTALRKLEQKLAEAKSLSDVLIARHRRSRALAKASDARMAMTEGSNAAAFDRMERKVLHGEAVSEAKADMLSDNTDEKLAALDKDDRIEQMLAELKARKGK